MAAAKDPWMNAMRLLRSISVPELPNGVGGPDAEFRVNSQIGLGDRVTFYANHPELGMIIDGHIAVDGMENVASHEAQKDCDRLNALLFYAWRRGFVAGKEYAEERA